MPDIFELQIDRFVLNTEEKLLAVTRESIEAVVEDAQLPGPSKNDPVGQGGKMRVDTGFLRATGLAQIGSMPFGPSNERDAKSRYVWAKNQLEIVLASMKIGDTLYFGWTADYARIREMYDGFLEGAVQKWQTHVDESVKRFKK